MHHSNHPLSNTLNNLPLKSLESDMSAHSLESAGTLTIGQLYSQDHFCSFQEPCFSFPISHSSFFRYLQIHHALRHVKLGNSDLIDAILDIFDSPTRICKGLSPLYIILSTLSQLEKLTPMSSLE